ncbi:hypothetical protein DSO57_1012946 [Entomophthora muscae]|uniref:Uncharacterized protein n=1 Tax=Entomophthora muscae TaxID=34485 RepID=A0ACC2SV08_9FUNG|nr:hypothetical protein DSO57_1012946 [Entomophthora muscae]
MPSSSPNLLTNHTGKLFGIVYITLTGVVHTIIPAVGPWSWLAPLLWWVLPAKNPAQVTPGNDNLAAQDWIPDIPDGFVLYQNIVIPLPAFNALYSQGFLQALSAMPCCDRSRKFMLASSLSRSDSFTV